MEDTIITLDASNGPVKYQNAIERTKMRLDFAIARGILLMPSRMIINTESIVGYNNNLTRVTDDMKLGVNNHVNLGTKRASLKHVAGGPKRQQKPRALLKRNQQHRQAIAPTRPGRMEPILLPKSFKPSPTFLPKVFIPFAAALAPSASI